MKTGLNPKYTGLPNEMSYISKSKDKFKVRKHIQYKSYEFGTYKTVEEAKKIRDILFKNNWVKTEEYYKEKYATPSFENKYIHKSEKGYKVVKNIDGLNRSFGEYEDIEEARKHRTQCIINNWEEEKL